MLRSSAPSTACPNSPTTNVQEYRLGAQAGGQGRRAGQVRPEPAGQCSDRQRAHTRKARDLALPASTSRTGPGRLALPMAGKHQATEQRTAGSWTHHDQGQRLHGVAQRPAPAGARWQPRHSRRAGRSGDRPTRASTTPRPCRARSPVEGSGPHTHRSRSAGSRSCERLANVHGEPSANGIRPGSL